MFWELIEVFDVSPYDMVAILQSQEVNKMHLHFHFNIIVKNRY
jgi:hypothetical protein